MTRKTDGRSAVAHASRVPARASSPSQASLADRTVCCGSCVPRRDPHEQILSAPRRNQYARCPPRRAGSALPNHLWAGTRCGPRPRCGNMSWCSCRAGCRCGSGCSCSCRCRRSCSCRRRCRSRRRRYHRIRMRLTIVNARADDYAVLANAVCRRRSVHRQVPA